MIRFPHWLIAFSGLFSVVPFASADTPAPATQPSREIYRKFAMVHQGDAAAGKALFLEPQKIACSNCHTTDGKGGKAGPDLFAIGDKFGRDDLIQQVLVPSATIAVGYSTTVIRTRSGDIVSGHHQGIQRAGRRLDGIGREARSHQDLRHRSAAARPMYR